MSGTLICDIVTPERLLFSEEVSFVAVPATEGEIGFLPLRTPIMSTLKSGEVRAKLGASDETVQFAVSGGYVEADGHKVVVLANRAVNVASVTLDDVKEKLAATERKLVSLDAADSQAAFYKAELSWYRLLEHLKVR